MTIQRNKITSCKTLARKALAGNAFAKLALIERAKALGIPEDKVVAAVTAPAGLYED